MLKIIELFAGVGSQTEALKNIGVEHEVIGISEIDKYAISSYTQLHGEVHNFGDISKIEKLPQADLWTYSFPCQDLSVAGKGQGIKQGTRSGLLLEVERLLEVSEKPKYLLMENVKNLVGKKNKADFDRWRQKLEELGYTNYWQVLNAKDYGIPQNRERVFMVSILGEHKPYAFPGKEELKLRLKDMLEKEVEPKYFLSQEIQNRFVSKKVGENIIGTTGPDKKIGQRDWVYTPIGIIGALTATDYKQPKQIMVDSYVRKITPKECWRLMGWSDEQFDKIKGISDTQLYKQAGNGIVVTVLEKIFKELFSYEITMKELGEEYQKRIEIELNDYVHNPKKYENLGYYDNED